MLEQVEKDMCTPRLQHDSGLWTLFVKFGGAPTIMNYCLLSSLSLGALAAPRRQECLGMQHTFRIHCKSIKGWSTAKQIMENRRYDFTRCRNSLYMQKKIVSLIDKFAVRSVV